MMKALYFAYEEIKPSSGIGKKILSECEGLRNSGVDIKLCCFKRISDELYAVIDNEPIKKFGCNHFSSFLRLFKFDYLSHYIQYNNVTILYIRYVYTANPFFIRFLKKLKKRGVKIILEIPTFPYDDEHRNCGFFLKLMYKIESYSRNSFKKCVDRIVTVQNYDSIFDVQTIKISNGINLRDIVMPNKKKHDEINMLGVASLGYWHGFDRLIEGIGIYKKNGGDKNIHFYIIGDNQTVINEYKSIVERYGIEDKIHFEGQKEGKELDSYFDVADLAIGSLGAHRKGVYEGKALKCVEYAARGIPFVYSDINSDFDNRSFIKRVSQDDMPIDVNELLVFLKGQKTSPVEIRQYVADNLTWDIQMKKVIDEISKLLTYEEF